MTPFQRELTKLWDAGLSYNQISRVTGRPLATISSWCRKLDLPVRDPAGLSDAQIETIARKLRITRKERAPEPELISRRCLRCGQNFVDADPPKIKRLCDPCARYARDQASALA